MQQTQKYKLNLIESSDPFLPEVLNQNTQKIEEVLSENLEGMESRVTVLEGHKLAYGAYDGNCSYPSEIEDRYFHTGFPPKILMLWQRGNVGDKFETTLLPEVGELASGTRAVADGFYISFSMNYKNTPYWFIAIR